MFYDKSIFDTIEWDVSAAYGVDFYIVLTRNTDKESLIVETTKLSL